MPREQGDSSGAGLTRRTFIKGAGAVAVLGGSLYPAPPRDAREDIGDLLDSFNF
jgi:hypothetical protein